jgi:hypothetical protein
VTSRNAELKLGAALKAKADPSRRNPAVGMTLRGAEESSELHGAHGDTERTHSEGFFGFASRLKS